MVDIQYRPIRTIVIHEVLKHQLNDFIAKTQNGRTAATVRWVDGIIFDFIGAQALTEKLIGEKMLQGKIHWEVIEFAEIIDYQPTVSHSQTGAILHVMDNSNNTAVADAISFIEIYGIPIRLTAIGILIINSMLMIKSIPEKCKVRNRSDRYCSHPRGKHKKIMIGIL